MVDLSTKIGKIRFKNPVLAASGTFGHAREFEKFFDLKKLGGIVTKTITVKPRLGNPPPRIVETPSGMLNAIGLQNPGVEKFIEEKLPYFRKLQIPILVSIMGYSVEELRAVVGPLEKAGGFDGYEINLSCPNVRYKAEAPAHPRGAGVGVGVGAPRMFAHDARLIQEAVSAVRKGTRRVVVAKLGPEVSDIGSMARAAQDAGADAVSLINTVTAMVINIETRKPVLANKTGGLSGPCVRPLAVRMVWEAAKAVDIPVVGIGGIMKAEHVIEFLIAGAGLTQIGTANFLNPSACQIILEDLKQYMMRHKIPSVESLVGSIQP